MSEDPTKELLVDGNNTNNKNNDSHHLWPPFGSDNWSKIFAPIFSLGPGKWPFISVFPTFDITEYHERRFWIGRPALTPTDETKTAQNRPNSPATSAKSDKPDAAYGLISSETTKVTAQKTGHVSNEPVSVIISSHSLGIPCLQSWRWGNWKTRHRPSDVINYGSVYAKKWAGVQKKQLIYSRQSHKKTNFSWRKKNRRLHNQLVFSPRPGDTCHCTIRDWLRWRRNESAETMTLT